MSALREANLCFFFQVFIVEDVHRTNSQANCSFRGLMAKPGGTLQATQFSHHVRAVQSSGPSSQTILPGCANLDKSPNLSGTLFYNL